MKRGLWFLAGAGAGGYAVLRARRLAEAVTAGGLRDRASALAVGVRVFTDEVRSGQAEKERELRHRLGLTPAGPPAWDRTAVTPPGLARPEEDSR